MKLLLNTFYNNHGAVNFKSVPVQNLQCQAVPNNFALPDLKQNDEISCAPVSAANAIMMLEKNSVQNPQTLADKLSVFFKTDSNGTTSKNLCEGLEKYFQSVGKPVKIEYQGFRDVDKKYKTAPLPDINKIKKAISEGKPVLLNFGVYKKENGNYKRQYGHFVTAVETGTNGISQDNRYVAVTDPYSKVKGKHYIKFDEIHAGKLFHNKDDNEIALIEEAKGFFEITPPFNYFRENETAVLNGAVIISR